MGLFGRLETGWALTKDSLVVLRRDPELATFPLVAATVGVVIRIIERQGRNSILARLFAGLFSVAWAILTYFVVPVIVFEDVGITEAISGSGE